jgi:cytochrome c oxidase assembly protein Cox11
MFKSDGKYWYYILLIFFVLMIGFGYSQHKSISNYKNQIQKFQLENQSFQEEIDRNGNTIVEQEQIILSQKDAIAHGLLEIDRLKKVQSQVNVVTTTIIDTVLVSHTDTVVEYINGDAFLKLPHVYNYNTEFLSFNALIKKDGFTLNNLKLDNKTTISVGFKGQGLFKPDLAVVELKHSNPYIKTVGVTNVVVEDKNPLKDKKLWGGLGFLLGLIVK